MTRTINWILILLTECELYKEAACRVDYVSTTPDADQYPQKFPECSATTQAVIMNGEEASRKEFPHMVHRVLPKQSQVFFSLS